jgi:hypothetical protein
MALFKDKWEIKTWADLSASVADAGNALEFRPKHRLPYDLQQGSKASKNVSGWFNRDSITSTSGADYDDGYFIFDTASKVSYTGIPKAAFKSDLTDFLMSSSLSSAAKSEISTSFNNGGWADMVVQIDSGSYPAATASWTVPCAIIGDNALGLEILNTSTNVTNLEIKAGGGLLTASVYEVEFTLPMETMSFTGAYASRSMVFGIFTGSEYSSAVYASSSIYTPHGEAQSTASLTGRLFGSGSNIAETQAAYEYNIWSANIKALGDDFSGSYSYSPKTEVLHFATGSQVLTQTFTRYDTTDTNLTGSSVTGSMYFISGSKSDDGQQFWSGQPGVAYISGSHIFAEASLATALPEGIYVPSGSSTGSLALLGPLTPNRVPRFSGHKYS